MSASPLDQLRQGRTPRGAERDALLRLLGSPIGWPNGAELRAAAAELGAREPTPLLPGQVPLVSYTPASATGVRSALWTSADAGTVRDAVRFIGSATAAHQLARRVALAGIPVLAPRVPVDREHEPVAVRVWRSGQGSDLALDGGSFGLGFALAEVSRILGVAVRSDVITSAALDAAGGLHRVGHLAEKIRVVFEAGLGIRTFVVASEQEDDAKRIANRLELELGRRLEIVGVRDVFAAVESDLFFERPIVDAWIARCRSPELRHQAIRSVFELAIRNARIAISWNAVDRAARELARLSESEDERMRAEVAARIARRHAGDRQCRIAWDDAWLGTLRRPLRVRAVAHVVQSATDACDDEGWERDATRASQILPAAGDETAEELELVGALGRAYASWGRDEAAWGMFERALRGWRDLGEEERASFALSALLALASVMGPDERRDAFCDDVFAAFDRSPRTDAVSRAFVGEARARMLESRGRLAEALEALRRSESLDAPPHLRGMRARTSARIARMLGDAGAAERARSVLDAPGVGRYQRLLFALDERLQSGLDASDLVSALRDDSQVGAFVARIERSVPGADAAAIRRRFPY